MKMVPAREIAALKYRVAAPVFLAAGTLLIASGCQHYEPKPLTIDKTNASYDERSLAADGLRRFLTRNLGRELNAWPLASWDFEALSWAAFYYHPSLAVARAQWESAQAAITSAAARPNPTVTLTPGYNTTRTPGLSPWMPAVSADFLFETANKRDLRTHAAQLGAEASRQAVFAAAWQVRSELRKALLDLRLNEQRAAALRAQAELQQRMMTLLEQRQRAGAISGREVSVGRVAFVRAESAAAEATRQTAVARQRVAQALGVPMAALTGVTLQPPPALPAAPRAPEEMTAARRQSLQTRADVLAALARFEATQAALALEVAKQRPDFHLGPGYQWDQGDNKWTLGLTLELPVFNRNEGPIAEAEARRRESAAQFFAVQAQALSEIDAALTAQQVAFAALDQLRRVQAEVTRQAGAAEQRLRAGGADQVEVLSAQLERATADLAVVEAEAQVASAAGQLENALQVPFAKLEAVATVPLSSP